MYIADIIGCFICCSIFMVDGACTVNSTILSFKESVPKGTVIMTIPRTTGEMWSFKEDGPKGYIDLRYDEDFVTFFFGKVPDLEEINKGHSKLKIRKSLHFTLECKYKGWKYVYKPAVVLTDVNDNNPVFNLRIPLKTHIPEVTSVGTVVFNLRHLAVDKDISGRIVGYSIHHYDKPQVDGFDYFKVGSNGHDVILTQNLDYDNMTLPYFMLNISAYDNGQPVARRGYTSLKVSIDDVDDLGPMFIYDDCPEVDGFCSTPIYETAITTSFQGKLKMWPGRIRAKDKDKINNAIFYSIIKVDPVEYEELFIMDKTTGEITMTSPVKKLDPETIRIGIKVEEDSMNQRFVTTNLRIQVRTSSSVSSRLVNGLIEVPVNDLVAFDKYSEQTSTTIPFSIFMSTVGLFLVIIGVLLIVFVKYYKEIPHSSAAIQPSNAYIPEPTRPPPPPPPKRVSSASVSSTTVGSHRQLPVSDYSCNDEDRHSTANSTASSASSVNLDFDDAISFAASKCRDSSTTPFPFSSNNTCYGSNMSPTGEENMGQLLRRKLHNIFASRESGQSTSSKGNRVRFDIRNISSFS